IIKASKKTTTKEFFDIQSFQDWMRKNHQHSHLWKIKYYKGLGTSSSKEAKENFKDFENKLIVYDKATKEDEECIQLAFQKNLTEQRKEWIRESTKHATEMTIPPTLKIKKLHYFFNNEFVHFSIADCR